MLVFMAPSTSRCQHDGLRVLCCLVLLLLLLFFLCFTQW
jgi:hypothetical protein